ncbi:MAG: OmpA family protein [Leptolyngbyaceae bacterium]|nr:OmpA family protein [Leptolyngbyaceae bacterium]
MKLCRHHHYLHRQQRQLASGILSLAWMTVGGMGLTVATNTAAKAEVQTGWQWVVNSNQDGAIQADEGLTLREAIALANGTLTRDRLSPAEQAQMTTTTDGRVQIIFNLPPDQTTIRLTDLLPDISRPNLVIDGTTQPGYIAGDSPISTIPIVTLMPAPKAEVFRGLTLVANGIVVRGLRLFGFTGRYRDTAITPPGDILIAHRLPPPDTTQQQQPAKFWSFYEGDIPPKDIVIEGNWLGIPPRGMDVSGITPSAFGVVVFNSQGAKVQRNWIANHSGSGIITSVRADNLQILDNLLTRNGFAGMPDAIRLEGSVDNTEVRRNWICENAGSGIYLFNPQGSTQIVNNQIDDNGKKFRRAGIYVMGQDHQILSNQITQQPGSGVVVASYPRSRRNRIEDNQFAAVQGLSIDLNTQDNVGVQDFEVGDGPNPLRNSENRRLDTGNAAINPPEFLSPEFYFRDNKVNIDGMADPGSTIQLYRAIPDQPPPGKNGSDPAWLPAYPLYGPLSEVLETLTTDEKGKFQATLTDLKPGDRITAIATDPLYGTSEPARNAVVVSLDNGTEPLPSPATSPVVSPPCITTAPPIQAEKPPIPTPIPEPIRIQVPRNIHFALDKDNISPASAQLLDRVVQVLTQYPSLLIDLIGHTDLRNTEAYNQALGLRRATATRNYLIRQGVDPQRITIRSDGESRLKVIGNQPIDHARNRRVEMMFKNMQAMEITFEDLETDLQLEPPLRPK